MTYSTKKRVTAADLGIIITPKGEKGLFQWFMCVLLFSKPIQQEIAAAAFTKLREHKLDSPRALKAAGWQKIVDVLNEAHYSRYDESTATRLLEAREKLEQEYNGRLLKVVEESDSPTELKKRVQEFKGIGKTGAEIFLREVKPVHYQR